MCRSQFVCLWTWIRRLPRNPLTLPFILAAVAGGGTTILVMWISAFLGLIFVLVGVPLIFGLLSRVPEIGGALSLGGNIGAAIVLVILFV